MAKLELNAQGETGCCRPFNPDPWEEKEIRWDNKRFVTDHVVSFMHIPLNMAGKMTKNMALIKKAGADNPEQIMLSDEKSLWGSDIYIAVDKDVPGAKMATLSGHFLTKVFEGPYKNISQWVKTMHEWVAGKDKKITKLYFSYTTCPRCAQAYGKNYVVLFAKID